MDSKLMPLELIVNILCAWLLGLCTACAGWRAWRLLFWTEIRWVDWAGRLQQGLQMA